MWVIGRTPSMVVGAAVLLTLAGACTDERSLTGPNASRPSTVIEGQDPSERANYTFGRLGYGSTYRTIPAEALDLMEQTARNVASDPTRSPQDQALAVDMLAKLPEFRAKLSLPYGAASQSVKPDTDLLVPKLGRNRQILVTIVWDRSEEVATAIGRGGQSVQPTFSFGSGGVMGGSLIPGPSCDREIWEWSKDVFYFGSTVIGVAATVSAIGASGGTATPVLIGALGTLGSGVVITVGNLYFSNRAMWDCVVAHNSAPRP